MYLTIKILHMSCAAISISGFIIRCILKLSGSKYIDKQWLKWVPHVVDTILLTSAVYLALQSQQYPITDSWLTAKIIGLLCYIGFGMIVLRFGKTKKQRFIGFSMAILSFSYIIGVAFTRSPALWF